MKGRLAGLKESSVEAETLREQIDKVSTTLAARQKRLAEQKQDAPSGPFDPDQVIREAYLRTLGRTPSGEEEEIARGYFRESGNTKGMRDLLWALLNTKEFITNH